MIGMQVTDADQHEVAQLRARLSEPEIGAAAHVDEHAGLAVDPQQIARRRPVLVEGRTGGSQNLQVAGPAAQLCAEAPEGTARTSTPYIMKNRRSVVMSHLSLLKRAGFD